MPITTMKTRTHTLYVWLLWDGDIAHPDGYAEVSYDPYSAHFTLPLDMIDEF